MAYNKKIISILSSLPQLKANIEIAKSRVYIVEKALKSLTAEEEQIACKLFVNGENPLDVSYDLNIEPSTFYRRRQQILCKLSKALFGNDLFEEEEKEEGAKALAERSEGK